MKGKVITGVCGKPCSGKSTFISLLCPREVTIIDCDALARDTLISHHYDIRVLLGTTDPKEIAEIIFNDKKMYDKYTALIWGSLRDVIEHHINEAKTEKVIIDAPLLLEADLVSLCDVVVRFVARPSRRVEWAKGRGWDEEELNRRDKMFIKGYDHYPF